MEHVMWHERVRGHIGPIPIVQALTHLGLRYAGGGKSLSSGWHLHLLFTVAPEPELALLGPLASSLLLLRFGLDFATWVWHWGIDPTPWLGRAVDKDWWSVNIPPWCSTTFLF